MGPQAGLLLERIAVPAVHWDAWNEQDKRRAMMFAEQDGVKEVRRYTRLEQPGEYLMIVELVSMDILPAVELPSPPATGGKADRRVYRKISGPAFSKDKDDSICGGAIVGMWWTPPPGGEAELTAWYDEEHTPMLMAVPGWLRVRRFALVRGGGPTFLALHDLADKEVYDHPAHQQAQNAKTPWWLRLRETRLDSEFTMWELSERYAPGCAQ